MRAHERLNAILWTSPPLTTNMDFTGTFWKNEKAAWDVLKAECTAQYSPYLKRRKNAPQK